MSLKAFHLLFVAVCVVLAIGVAWWGLRDYRASHSDSSLYLGVGCVAAAVVMAVYGRWFLRKSRHLSMV